MLHSMAGLRGLQPERAEDGPIVMKSGEEDDEEDEEQKEETTPVQTHDVEEKEEGNNGASPCSHGRFITRAGVIARSLLNQKKFS
ncbi:hypothetical protein scyTo_0016239 [Scyliorhinus torazame]|uniref:Uncharacterized protein n=1 Tax=Scyliorhinus torazame TaxID=75743 RepID=A0A401Q585_SCYTO|nr:hypothetical protein [Scyliorhinus torazame]